MAYGHTDDVPNTFDLEAMPTPESSSLPPDVKLLYTMNLIPYFIKNAQLQNIRLGSANEHGCLRRNFIASRPGVDIQRQTKR
ncbi:MAG: hypothetical protein COA78_19040 [Blastopirellula sp.]|nr:MAG: hypothetical protein COA78_19040 [Blastopirellula sp.]